MPIHIQVSPTSCLADQCPMIRVTSAEKDSEYTIKGSIKTRENILVSYGHFKSSSTGEIDPSQQPSLGGTYTGVDEAGLLWSLQSLNHKAATFLSVKDVHQPLQMYFSVHQGALTAQELESSDAKAECQLLRTFLSENVQSHEVSEGMLRGISFKPPGKGPFPGLIDMYGGTSGLIATRAALLASYGFATFALPYFAYKDLVKTFAEFDLEYFEEALTWYSSQEFVDPSRIGLIGTSLGAVLCLVISVFMPDKVRAVVSYNSPNHRMLSSLKYKGEYLPFIHFKDDLINTDGEMNILKAFGGQFINGSELTTIQIEKAKADFLFIAGEDDQIVPSAYCASKLAERLSRHGHHNHNILTYPGTGHAIEPGLLPMTNKVKHPFKAGVTLICGGSLPGHAKAQEHSWARVKEFLKDKLA